MFGKQLLESIEQRGEYRTENLVLVSEIVVNIAKRYPRQSRDSTHRSIFESLLQKLSPCRLQNTTVYVALLQCSYHIFITFSNRKDIKKELNSVLCIIRNSYIEATCPNYRKKPIYHNQLQTNAIQPTHCNLSHDLYLLCHNSYGTHIFFVLLEYFTHIQDYLTFFAVCENIEGYFQTTPQALIA